MIEPITAEKMERDYVYALHKAGLLIPTIKTGRRGQDMACNYANQRGIDLSEFFGTTREARVAQERQNCMALLKETTDLSHPEIGRIFNRHHSTVMHAIKAVERRQAEIDARAQEGEGQKDG